MWIEPEAFEPVTDTLEKFGYEPFSPPGDRHGSWQWPFYKEFKGLTRFVILAATLLDPEDVLQVEIWIGAEADQRFTRERIEFHHWGTDDLPRKVEILIPDVEQAIERANALNWSDLEQEKPAPSLQAAAALAR